MNRTIRGNPKEEAKGALAIAMAAVSDGGGSAVILFEERGRCWGQVRPDQCGHVREIARRDRFQDPRAEYRLYLLFIPLSNFLKKSFPFSKITLHQICNSLSEDTYLCSVGLN